MKVESRAFLKLLNMGYERKNRVKYDSWVWGLSTRREVVISLVKEYCRSIRLREDDQEFNFGHVSLRCQIVSRMLLSNQWI